MINNTAIILVRPQLGENIGASARAMLNFGLTDLRIVAPRDGWPSLMAERASAGALEGDLMNVRVFETLPEALTDLHVTYATTARTRDINKAIFTPAEAARDIQAGEQKAGIVFGPERTGLENDDLQYCQHILSFPVNPDFSSLNIAQAVLLMAYTLFQPTTGKKAQPIKHESELPATQDKLEEFFLRLENTLEQSGFYKAPHLKDSIQRNVRTMLMRADFTGQELGTLQGILSALAGKR